MLQIKISIVEIRIEPTISTTEYVTVDNTFCTPLYVEIGLKIICLDQFYIKDSVLLALEIHIFCSLLNNISLYENRGHSPIKNPFFYF